MVRGGHPCMLPAIKKEGEEEEEEEEEGEGDNL